jgi:L-fucose isomerase-like protein
VVTLARLSEASGEFRLVIGRGEVLEAPKSFSGTSGVLRFDRDHQAVFETILSEGLEHHVSLTYGDYTAELELLAEMLDLPVIHL